MPAPTPVTEKYIPCAGLTGLIAGVPMTVTEGGFGVKVDVDEMTNNQGYSYYEDVPTTRMASFKMTIAATSAGLTGLVPGSVYPVLINTAAMPTFTAGVGTATPVNANAPCFAGDVRLQLDDVGILDPHKGVKYGMTGQSQGPFAVAI